MNTLDTDQQIDKLQQAMRLAEQAAASGETASRLGALVLYTGVVDFLAIQAARLVEQIVLKGELAKGQQPAFMPNDDSFFYQRKVSTARILKGIRKLLPFADVSGEKGSEPARITRLAETMIGRGLAFLDHRDPQRSSRTMPFARPTKPSLKQRVRIALGRRRWSVSMVPSPHDPRSAEPATGADRLTPAAHPQR